MFIRRDISESYSNEKFSNLLNKVFLQIFQIFGNIVQSKTEWRSFQTL